MNDILTKIVTQYVYQIGFLSSEFARVCDFNMATFQVARVAIRS